MEPFVEPSGPKRGFHSSERPQIVALAASPRTSAAVALCGLVGRRARRFGPDGAQIV
jgi:hypothetical protein